MRRISIYQRKGRKGWTVQFYDGRGRRCWAYAETEKAAGEEADRILAVQRAAEGLADDLLLKDYSVVWFRRIQKELAPSSAATYAWAIDNHVLPALGERRLREIQTSHVKNFLTEKRHEGLAKESVRTIRSTLHILFEEARDDGIVKVNPVAFRAKRMRLRRSKEELRAKVKALTTEQLRDFAAAAVSTLSRSSALQLRVMWSTGIRPGEALALEWSDFHGAGAQLRIERGYTRFEVRTTKTGAVRDVDLPRGLVAELEAWDTETKAAALGTGRPRPDWIFPTRSGAPRDHKAMHHDFTRALKAAKLPPHFTPHCLRHTYATLQLIRGVSIYYVQQQLGHASIQMTVDHYGSWLPAGNPDHADGLEQQIAGAPGGHENRKDGRSSGS